MDLPDTRSATREAHCSADIAGKARYVQALKVRDDEESEALQRCGGDSHTKSSPLAGLRRKFFAGQTPTSAGSSDLGGAPVPIHRGVR